MISMRIFKECVLLWNKKTEYILLWSLWLCDWWQERHSPSGNKPARLDGILLGSLDRIWQFCNVKKMLICIFLKNIWRGEKSGFGKLFSSQKTEAVQTAQLSLAGHHSHPMYLFFFSDKRATFGIAQAAELIIRPPQGCFKLQGCPPRVIWSQHNHRAEREKKADLLPFQFPVSV